MAREEYTPERVTRLLREAEILIENWRRHYNAIRPRLVLGYRGAGTSSEAQNKPQRIFVAAILIT